MVFSLLHGKADGVFVEIG